MQPNLTYFGCYKPIRTHDIKLVVQSLGNNDKLGYSD